MDLGIEGRTALVMAASKGIGKAAALALAAEGTNVVICARGPQALAETAAEIERTGAEVLALQSDVTEPDAPKRLVEATVDRFGACDILVANAGGPPPGTSLAVTDDQLTRAFNDNALSSIRAVRAVHPHMAAAGWGRICLVTSMSIKQPIEDLALSNVARTGLWAWVKTAAADLFESSITMTVVCPGLHATERMKDLGRSGVRMGDPEDLGRIIAFLCSEPAAFMAGAAISVDGTAVRGLL